MSTIAMLQVNIGANTKEAEEGLKRVDAAVRKTAAASRGVGGLLTAPLELLGSVITAPIRGLMDMTGRVTEMAAGFALGQIGVQGLTGAFGFLEEAIIGHNAKMEQSLIAWTQFLGTRQDAEAMVSLIQKFAATTPFDNDSVEKATRQIVSYGFEVKDALDMTRDFGNASSGLNVGAEGMERMIRAVGQMNAKGKVMAEDLQQLSELGVNLNQVFAIMSQQTGKTASELRSMQSNGSLAASTFIAAFREWSRVRYGDMMAAQSKTFAGSIETIKDSITQASATAFKPLFDRISQLAQNIAQFVSSDQFPAWAGRVAAYVEVVIQSIGGLIDAFSSGFRSILEIVVNVGQLVYQALSWINPFATHSPSLVSQVNDGVDFIIAKYRSLSSIVGGINSAKGAIQALNQAAGPGMAEKQARDNAERDKRLGMLGPDVVSAYQASEAAVAALEERQKAMTLDIQRQTLAVSAAEDALRSYDQVVRNASDAVEAGRDSLNLAREQMDAYRDAVSEARSEISRLAQAPLAGSKAFSDRLFGLDQQVTTLQLRLTRMRLSGAPEADIKALQKEIETLQLKSEETRLDEKIQLDPLRRQIDQLANGKTEMAFDAIISGITEMQAKEREAVAALGPATAAYEAQERAVKGLERALKEAQKVRDTEAAKVDAQKKALSEQQEAYSALDRQVNEWRKSMEETTRAAEELWRVANSGGTAGSGAGAGGLMGAVAAGAGDLSFLEDAKKKTAEFKENFEKSVEQIKKTWQPTIDGLTKSVSNLATAIMGVSESVKIAKEQGLTAGLSDLLYPVDRLDESFELQNEMAQRRGRPEPYKQPVRFTDPEALQKQIASDVEAALGKVWEVIRPTVERIGTTLGDTMATKAGEAFKAKFNTLMFGENIDLRTWLMKYIYQMSPEKIAIQNSIDGMNDGNDVGLAVAQGFNKGLQAGSAESKQAVKEYIDQNIKMCFVDELEIHSPSQVAFRWGEAVSGGLWDGIASRGSQLLTDVSAWMTTNLIDPIKNVLGIGGERVTTYGYGETAGSELIKGLASKLEALKQQAIDFGKALMEGIKQGMASITIPIPRFDVSIGKKNILGREADWPMFNLGFDWKTLAELMGAAQLANGGIATRPTFGVFGEAGPEAIVPLNQYNALARQASPIDYRLLGREVAAALREAPTPVIEMDGVQLGRVVRRVNNQHARSNAILTGA